MTCTDVLMQHDGSADLSHILTSLYHPHSHGRPVFSYMIQATKRWTDKVQRTLQAQHDVALRDKHMPEPIPGNVTVTSIPDGLCVFASTVALNQLY